MRGIFLPVAVSALKHEGVLYVRAVLVLTVQGPHGGARQQAIVFAPLGEGKVSATRNQRHVRAVCALGLLVFVSIRLGMPQYATVWRG